MTADVLNPQGALIVRAVVGPTLPLEPAGGPAGVPSPELCRRIGFALATRNGIDPVIELALNDDCTGRIELPPGRYVLNLHAQVMAASKDLPMVVDVHANEVTEVAVSIDLGIR